MLAIDDEARKKVADVLIHALDPANWYRLGVTSIVPGDDPRFVAQLDTYRCVFTITKYQGHPPMRHLSISIPSKDFAHPYATYAIAQLFGFTGWDEKTMKPPDGWMMDVNYAEHCIVIVQPYDKAEATA